MTIPFLPERFLRPDGYVHATYTSSLGAKIRYGFLPALQEKAIAIYLGGQTQFLEMDYENARDLSARGITTYFVERHGDGGSERYSSHPQKPPALPYSVHVADLYKFVRQEISLPRNKPLLLFGSCLGGLIALKAAQQHDDLFDHVILTSPMLGTHHPTKGRDALRWAVTDITPETEQLYYGHARDWLWEDARRWIAKDQTTHDVERKAVHYLWRKVRCDLRLGGYTHGNIIRNCRALVEAVEESALRKVQTPITIVSAEQDVINQLEPQRRVAELLPNGHHVVLAGAKHGLWREADFWRDQLLEKIDAVVAAAQQNIPPRRVTTKLRDKTAMWSPDW